MSKAVQEKTRCRALIAEYKRRIRLLEDHENHVAFMVLHDKVEEIQAKIEGHNSWKADEEKLGL